MYFNSLYILSPSDIIVVLCDHSYLFINVLFLRIFFILSCNLYFYLELFIKHWNWELVFFFSFGKFSTIIFSNIASIIFSFFHPSEMPIVQDFWIMYHMLLMLFPFLSFHFFSLCFSLNIFYWPMFLFTSATSNLCLIFVLSIKAIYYFLNISVFFSFIISIHFSLRILALWWFYLLGHLFSWTC